MKLKVVSLDGGNPTIGQYLLRWIFRLIDFTITSHLAGVISVAVSQKRQRIGDLVAGTTIIKTQPKTTIKQVAFVAPEDGYEVVFPEAAQLTDSEVNLIIEVGRNFKVSENYELLHKTATKIQNHLNITDRKDLDDLSFLRTIVKDFNYLQAVAYQDAR